MPTRMFVRAKLPLRMWLEHLSRPAGRPAFILRGLTGSSRPPSTGCLMSYHPTTGCMACSCGIPWHSPPWPATIWPRASKGPVRATAACGPSLAETCRRAASPRFCPRTRPRGDGSSPPRRRSIWWAGHCAEKSSFPRWAGRKMTGAPRASGQEAATPPVAARRASAPAKERVRTGAGASRARCPRSASVTGLGPGRLRVRSKSPYVRRS